MKDTTALFLGALAAGTLGMFAFNNVRATKEISRKVNGAIDGLAGKSSVEISDFIVDEAVKKAADVAARSSVNKIASKYDFRIKEAVDEAVKDEAVNLGDKVLKAFESRDIDELVDRVQDKVAKEAYNNLINKINKYNNNVLLKTLAE